MLRSRCDESAAEDSSASSLRIALARLSPCSWRLRNRNARALSLVNGGGDGVERFVEHARPRVCCLPRRRRRRVCLVAASLKLVFAMAGLTSTAICTPWSLASAIGDGWPSARLRRLVARVLQPQLSATPHHRRQRRKSHAEAHARGTIDSRIQRLEFQS